jgi:uroporphyrinogen-III synthase
MDNLSGIRVALLEGRMSGELEKMVRKYGGDPYCVPAVREEEVEAPAEVKAALEALESSTDVLAIFETGVGVDALFRAAEKLGEAGRLQTALVKSSLLARGPKPAAALKRRGLTNSLPVAEPYTTKEIIDALKSMTLKNRPAVLLHYGERNAALVEALTARGAKVREVLLYTWRLPENTGGLETLVSELAQGKVEAVAFTSQVQVRHLFQIADKLGKREALAQALNGPVKVAAVGPTCDASLKAHGVKSALVPEHPKMGTMVAAMASAWGK